MVRVMLSIKVSIYVMVPYLCGSILDDILFPDAVSNAVNVFNGNPESLMIHGHSELFGDSINTQLVGLPNGNFSSKYPAFMSFPQPASFLDDL